MFQALQHGFFDFETFDVDEYEHYEVNTSSSTNNELFTNYLYRVTSRSVLLNTAELQGYTLFNESKKNRLTCLKVISAFQEVLLGDLTTDQTDGSSPAQCKCSIELY